MTPTIKVMIHMRGMLNLRKNKININKNLPQPVFEIDYKSKIVMVPIHKDLIIKIDNDKKNIFFRIPDGLLDI